MDAPATPPTGELYTRRQLVERHPNILTTDRLAWALRQRRTNGLLDARAVFDSPCGETIIHEPPFLVWFLGLSGRAKPRRRSAAS